MADADQVILTSSLVTLASMTALSIAPKRVGGKGELPSPKLLVGTGLTVMGLSLLGQFAPGVAKPLAVSMAVTALLYYGIPLADNYFNGTRGYSARVKTSQVAGPANPATD